jgi:hypothetical protein
MEFPTKLFLVLLSISLCWGFSRFFAGTIKFTSAEQTSQIQKDIALTFFQPTPWNYYFSSAPWAGANSLNKTVDATVVISDKQFFDTEKAIRFSVPIYVDFLRKVNSVRSMRQFLLEFPATPNICLFAIRFLKPNSNMDQEENIIRFSRGIQVIRWNPHPNNPARHREPILQLLPEQVPELAALYTKGVPRRSIDPKPLIRPVPDLNFFSKENPHRVFFEGIKQWIPSLNLKLILMGPTDRLKSLCSSFSFVATGTQKISLQEARLLAAACSKDSIQFLKTNQSCIKFISELGTERNFDTNPVLYLSFRLSFWDENIDRIAQPFIAEIRFIDGVISYYTADEGQFLVLVHQETFDEAIQFLEQSKKTPQDAPLSP